MDNKVIVETSNAAGESTDYRVSIMTTFDCMYVCVCRFVNCMYVCRFMCL